MNSKQKQLPTPVTDIIRIIQEWDFTNMTPKAKEEWFKMFLDWEKLHMHWTYNHGYADGKFPREQDFKTYYEKNYKTTPNESR